MGPEILYNPSLIGNTSNFNWNYQFIQFYFILLIKGLESQNLPEIIQKSIELCDRSIKPLMKENILVMGGVSLTQNTSQRLNQEVIV